MVNQDDCFLRVSLMSKYLKFDSSSLLLKSCVAIFNPFSRSSRRGSGGVFVDVLWMEPAGTWLESSQLLGSDLVSSRLLVAELLVVSCRKASMVVV